MSHSFSIREMKFNFQVTNTTKHYALKNNLVVCGLDGRSAFGLSQNLVGGDGHLLRYLYAASHA